MIHPVDPATLALLLADARLPVGAHVNSSGLEPALLAGLATDEVARYMITRMRTVTLVEAATAIVARRVCLGSDASNLRTALEQVEAAWSARSPSPALREISRSLGKGLLRLALRLWPDDPALLACQRSAGFARPVVLGAIASSTGISAESLARIVFYDDAQSVASAMLKLEPLDPVLPVGWVLDACRAAEVSIPMLALLTSADAIPAAGAPQIEEWAEAHSSRTQRLFRA